MAEKETDGPAEESQQPEAESKRKKLWSRLANRRTLAAVLALSVIAHGVGFIYYNKLRQIVIQSPEVALGEFEFESADTRRSRVTRAGFSLYVSLLSDIDRTARARLYTRRFRVQQDIEQLLRNSQGGDFEDHELAELKRQIQEQINKTLDMRAIADVIITNLAVERSGKPPSHGAEGPTTTPDGQASHSQAAPAAATGAQVSSDSAGASAWDTTPPQ